MPSQLFREDIVLILGNPQSWIDHPPSIGEEKESAADSEIWLYFNDAIGFVGMNCIIEIYFIPSKVDSKELFSDINLGHWTYKEIERWLKDERIDFSSLNCADRSTILRGELFLFIFPRFENGVEKALENKKCLIVHQFRNSIHLVDFLSDFTILD